MSVAYRMLGSVADAEDAVQDAFVRYQTAGGVSSPEGFLIRTTTRLCIDRLRARRRREYVGPWVPEPVETQRAGIRPGRVADAGVPAPPGAADAGRAGGVPAPHRVRLRVRRDRRGGGAAGGDRPADRQPGPAAARAGWARRAGSGFMPAEPVRARPGRAVRGGLPGGRREGGRGDAHGGRRGPLRRRGQGVGGAGRGPRAGPGRPVPGRGVQQEAW